MVAQVQIIEDTFITSDILTNKIQIVNGERVSQRVMNGIFDNKFLTYMDKTNYDLEYD